MKKAPWPDFAGFAIHEGDTICHPDGTRGVVRFLPHCEDVHDQWRVDYDDGTGPLSRLSRQIGYKGQAVVEKRPDQVGEGLK